MRAHLTRFDPRHWRLRTRIIVPTLIVILAAVVNQVAQDFSVRQQTQILVAQRGRTVLDGITQRIDDRRHTKEIYAQLLADENGLATLVAERDTVGLSQILSPEKIKLDLERLAVYDATGELAHLGPSLDPMIVAPLVAAARAGVSQSTEDMSEDGLLVAAASPIKGSAGIVGVLVVGRVFGPVALSEVQGPNTVDLALFRADRLIATTTEQPHVADLLRNAPARADASARFKDALRPYSLEPVAKSVGQDGLLLALVPTHDLDLSAQERTTLGLGGTAVVGLILLLAGVLLARAIAGPIDSLVDVTADMVHGNYARRIGVTRLPEFEAVGSAVNHLAQEIERRLAELSHQAFHDPLTDLPNRALFLDRVEHALARRQPNPIAVLFVDLDDFKMVNDTLGHAAGDQFLLEVRTRLQSCARAEDTLARLGGDEFTLLVESTHGLSEAIVIAERIQEVLREPIVLGGQELYPHASVGIAIQTSEHRGASDLLRDADVAMYRAKFNGKGRFEVFDREMGARLAERLELETDLRHAVQRNELSLVYQPIIDLKTGLIREVEALARWQHPRRGTVPPAVFIAVAEDSGQIETIGEWVLLEACRQAHSWRTRLPAANSLVMGVNVSARQLQQPDVLDVVANALRVSGLHPSGLKLEITESVAMKNAETTVRALRELRGLGLRLAIDDFGTGYSSLAYLNRFPIDTLKIDRSFVANLADSTDAQAIVRTIIALANTLGLRVTAEGVETAEQDDVLRVHGCDLGQGYYYARPQPAQAVTSLLVGAPRPLTEQTSLSVAA